MKPLFALALAALAVAGSLPAPAIAQDNGQELDRTYLRTAKGTRDLARMVDCLINQNPKLARELFALTPGSPEYSRAGEQFFEHGGGCLFMTWRLETSGLMARGAVAELLIEADRPTEIVDPPSVSFIRGGGSYRWQWRNLPQESAQRLVPVADCLVSRHGARARRHP